MNWAHVHLLLNHAPVVGIMVVIPLLAWGLWRRSQDLMRASLVLLVLLAAVALVVFFTGEPAEELVENLPGVSESILERHEEAALVATLAFEAVGVVALAGLILFRRRPVSFRFAALLLVLATVPAGTVAWAASLGGQIRHSEIRPGADVPVSSETVPRPLDRRLP